MTARMFEFPESMVAAWHLDPGDTFHDTLEPELSGTTLKPLRVPAWPRGSGSPHRPKHAEER